MKMKMKMRMEIEMDLRPNSQNGKTCALSLLTGWRRWLVHHPKTEGDHLKKFEIVEIVAALIV